MTSLKEEAEQYEPDKIKSVADLPYISIDAEVQEETDCEFPYRYIQVDGERYKVTKTVLGSIKEIIEVSPKITKFKVKKTGEGKKTKYTVIPLS